MNDSSNLNEAKTETDEDIQQFEGISLVAMLETVFYCIMCSETFRKQVAALVDPNELFLDILSLDRLADARTAHLIIEYEGNECIECKKPLERIFSKSREDGKGCVATVYSKIEPPKLAIAYRKRCNNCKIWYSYNQIHYNEDSPMKAKQGDILFLDPTDYPYFTTSSKVQKLVHHSIIKSIFYDQFGTTSRAISSWTNSFNRDWEYMYRKLKAVTGQDEALGYRTILRYFWIHCLLSILAVECPAHIKLKNGKTIKHIDINGKEVKIAGIITGEDKLNIVGDAKTDDIKIADFYLKLLTRKHEQTILRAEVPELRLVPVRLNDNDEIEVYAGHWSVYGDGVEKLHRAMCGYPDILGKLEYLESNPQTNDDEKKDNTEDDDIDFEVNDTAAKYTAARYYECDNYPQRAGVQSENTSNTGYRTCPHHTSILQTKYKIPAKKINSFVDWYHLHKLRAKLLNTDVKESINELYTMDNERIKQLKKVKIKKCTDTEQKLRGFDEKDKESVAMFKTILRDVQEAITQHEYTNLKRSKRKCSRNARNKIKQQMDDDSNDFEEMQRIATTLKLGQIRAVELHHFTSRLDVYEHVEKLFKEYDIVRFGKYIKDEKILSSYCRDLKMAMNVKGPYIPKPAMQESIRQRFIELKGVQTGIVLSDPNVASKKSQKKKPKKSPRKNSRQSPKESPTKAVQYDASLNLDLDHLEQPMDVRDIVSLETRNDVFINSTKGCRKASNMNIASAFKTHGLNALMTCSGFIIRLREEIVRETPTGCIIDIADAFTANDSIIQSANRIEALGYDMMCRMYYTLRRLLNEAKLSAKQERFWSGLLERLFVDIWHIHTHIDKLCKQDSDEAIFHPKLAKYKNILHHINETLDRCNDIVVEQFWSTTNSAKHFKAMCKETGLIFLYLKRKHHNQERMKELKKKGYIFVDVEFFTTLRDISAERDSQWPSTNQLIETANVELETVKVKPDKVQTIKKKIQESKQNQLI